MDLDWRFSAESSPSLLLVPREEQARETEEEEEEEEEEQEELLRQFLVYNFAEPGCCYDVCCVFVLCFNPRVCLPNRAWRSRFQPRSNSRGGSVGYSAHNRHSDVTTHASRTLADWGRATVGEHRHRLGAIARKLAPVLTVLFTNFLSTFFSVVRVVKGDFV